MSESKSDSTSSAVRKPSGLKPPSKIARPTNIPLDKTSDRGTGDDSSFTAARKLNDTIGTVADDGENFIVGDRVWVGGTKPGVIAFIGETQFGPGDWAGVVLDEPIGKNDGAVAGVRYFQCAPNKGIFARPIRLTRFPVSAGSKDYGQLSSTAHYSTPVTPDRHRTLSSASFSSSVASSRLRTPLSHVASGNSEVKVGDRVIVQSSHGSKAGMLRYFGTTEFGSGLWCGVELDDPQGKNDGSVAGVKYFDCAPKFGLFVPAEKVSRSPISKKSGPPCVIHPEGITRQGTRESLRSTSTVQTSATSNLRTSRKSPKTLGSSFTCAPRSPLQDQVKEKEAYIQQLLKERELERAQVTTAATQAEEAEKKLIALQSEYEQVFAQHEIRNTNLSQTIEKLEREKTNLLQQLEESKKKLEDLQFNLEEESITKSEFQALNEEYVEKLKNFERVVSSQHASLECDAHSSGIYTAEGSSEKGSSPGAQPPSLQADPTEFNEELLSGRRMIVVLTEKTTELENECQQLRESLDKLKLVDRGKDEMINTLRNELTSCQQTTIGVDATAATPAHSHIVDTLKSKLAETELENASLRTKIASAHEKLNALENSVRQKSAQVESDQRENETRLEKIRNDLQFEIDENKVRMEEATLRLEELTAQLAVKGKESAALAECIARLCNEIDQRNTVVNRVILDTEDAADNIAQAIDAATTLRREQDFLSQIADCDRQPKEKIHSLLERVDQSNENSIVLLKKLETLAEVISRKDTLLEESVDEKETLRREFQESIQLKANELKQLESKYADLEKVKNDVEKQLRKSEESIKSTEQSICGKEAELKREAAGLRCDLENKRVEYDRLMRELASLKDDLRAAEDKSHAERLALEDEIGALRLQIEGLTTSLNAATEEKKKLRRDYVELSKLNEFTMRVIGGGENEDSIENFNVVLRDDDDLDHVHAVEKNVRAYESQCEKLKNTVDALNASNAEYRQKAVALEDECRRQREEKEKESEQVRMELTKTVQKLEALSAEKAKLLQRMDTLEGNCKQLREDKDALKKEKDELRAELQRVTVTLQSQQMQFADTESETTAMKERLIASALTEVRLKDLEDEHERIQTAFEQLERTKTELQSELDQSHEQKAEMRNELEATNRVKENLQRKTDQLSNNVCLLEKQLGERGEEVAQVRRTAETLRDEFESAKTEMESQLRTLNAEIARLKNELDAKREENADLARKLDELATNSKEAAVGTAEKERQQSETLRILRDSSTSLEIAKNRTQAELEIAHEENTRLKRLLEKSDEERQKFSADWSALSEKEAERERQLKDLTENLQTLRGSKNELEEKLTNACAENVRLREGSGASEKERQRLLEKTKEFSSDSVFLNEKIAEKERELLQLLDSRDTLQRTCTSLETSVNKLESDLEEAKRESVRVRNELTVVDEEKCNLAKKADELIQNSRSLNDEIVAREQKLEALQTELSVVKDASGKTVEELKQLRQTHSILEDANTSLSAELKSAKEIRIELENKRKESELERLGLEEKLTKLADEKQAREANHRLTTELNVKLQTLQRELESKERSYRAELAEVDESIRTLAVEKDTLTAQLELAKNEIIKLSRGDTKERETKSISIDNVSSSSKVNSPSNIANDEYSQLLEDKTTAENQVQFLNSVIVDMQRKNEKLLERVQYLENIIPPDILKPKKVVTPRLFCDICDVFDLHDTDDCPVQCGSSSPTLNRRETNKVKPPPRPYCESCEVFGHTRDECNEEETF